MNAPEPELPPLQGALAGVVVLIPSYHPGPSLLETVRAVRAHGIEEVIVVDDGSGPAHAERFAAVAAEPGCTVLTHPENRGKGAALKTGFEHCLVRDDVRGVVTADADGQHLPEDVLRVATSLAGHLAEREEDVAVLGVRDFTLRDLPLRSRVGNRLTTGVVRLLYGQAVPDTQTGLRGFSHGLLPTLLEVRGTRFEYEMNALAHLLTYHVPLHQVPIETVYHDAGNSQSHFRPVRDSARVYSGLVRQFARFLGTSLLGAGIDLLVFVALIDGLYDGRSTLGTVGASTTLARVMSSLVNYTANRQAVFDIRRPVHQSFPRYALLAVTVLLSSAVLVTGLSHVWSGRVVWAKITVDSVLFVVSYLIQKRWVFTPRRPRTPV